MSVDDFGYVADVDVRFRDIDLMGHVNNAVVVTYLEEARVDYYHDVIGLEADELGFVLAHIEVDYETVIEHGDDVRVGVRTSDIGERSMTTEYTVDTGTGTAATAESVQVAVSSDGEPRRVPDGWRRAVREYEGL